MFDRRSGRMPQLRGQRVIACVAGPLGVLMSLLTGAALAARTSPVALTTVRAVNVDSGRIAAMADVGARGRYRLAVPAGAYLVVRSTVLANGASSDRVGRLALVRAAARARDGRTAAVRPVVTIGKVTLGPARGAPGSTRGVGAFVLRELFNPLTSRGIAFVDLSAQVVATSKREQQLSNEGRLATPVSYSPLTPTYEITGSGTQMRNGQLTMTLNLKNLVTGQVVVTKSVTGKGRTFGQVEGLFDQLSSDFAGDAAREMEQAPTGGGVSVTLGVTFLREGAGSGTMTASPPGRTFHQSETFQFKVPGATTVSLQAKPDPGSYFVGWESGSRCGSSGFQSSATVYPCAISDSGAGIPFVISAGPNFSGCPPPGTYVNDPNESVCAGVIVIRN